MDLTQERRIGTNESTMNGAADRFSAFDEDWTRPRFYSETGNLVELRTNSLLKTETNIKNSSGDCLHGNDSAAILTQSAKHYAVPPIDPDPHEPFYDIGGCDIYGAPPLMDCASQHFYPDGTFTRKPFTVSSAGLLDTRVLNFDHSLENTNLLFPVLRVCQICGEQASGCHYGVLTCASCKVFFKRAAEGKHKFLCAARNNCTIDKLRRRNCPSCRLKRCIESGMSLRARKLGKIKQAVAVRSDPAWVPVVTAMTPVSPLPALRDQHGLLSILARIEPAPVNAGHDPAQPDSADSLLTSLNELGERQLVTVVKWAKGVPGFQKLHVDDQLAVIQYSWMEIMVFALGWRSFKNVNARMLYFAPDLVFNDQRMQVSSMYEHCLRMRHLSQRFGRLKVTQEEFHCMKALLLFSVVPEHGLKSQRCFDELRSTYFNELDRLVSHTSRGDHAERLFQLTQLLNSLHRIVRKLHQFTYNLFVQAQSLSVKVNFPDMISDIISVHVPKILTGMARPVLFHE
ncbi:progesterone receptor-like [Brachyhypopomus gauderio]|uniref:progesterone receptor-like n=1 Tax=Brachyhypopomus gauderio TaxID=698409 RepID=UPI004042EE38